MGFELTSSKFEFISFPKENSVSLNSLLGEESNSELRTQHSTLKIQNYSLFPIPHSLFPIPYSPFPIPNSQFPINLSLLLALSQPPENRINAIVSVLQARFQEVPESVVKTLSNLEEVSLLNYLKKAISSSDLINFLEELNPTHN